MKRFLLLLIVAISVTACGPQSVVETSNHVDPENPAYARRVQNAMHLTAMLDERIDRSQHVAASWPERGATVMSKEGRSPALELATAPKSATNPDICPLTTEEGRAILAQTPEGRALLDQQ